MTANAKSQLTPRGTSIHHFVHDASFDDLIQSNEPVTQKIRRRPIPSSFTEHEEARSGFAQPLLAQGDELEDISYEHATFPVAKRRGPASKRLGLLAISIIVIGIVVIIAALGFLSFLWFARASNATWRHIATASWMTRAVSLTALAIRTAVSMQAVIATAMLAGLALERNVVLAIHLASVSTMRNANSGPLWLSWLTSRALWNMKKGWKELLLPSTLLALTITTLLIQFSSTALLADLSLSPTSGQGTSYDLFNHFIYGNSSSPLNQLTRGSSWFNKPPFYPAFAEYSEPSTNSNPDIVDTGLLLRAFLPLQDQQARYNVGGYQGIATVLDSHVMCMRPQLEEPQLHLDASELSGNEQTTRYALISPVLTPTHVQELVSNQPFQDQFPDWVPTKENTFGCLMDLTQPPDDVWRLSLCQIELNAALLSEWANVTLFENSPPPSGTTYLALNVSSGTSGDWLKLTAQDPMWDRWSAPGFVPVSTVNNGEWLDLNFGPDGTTRLSVSLCFAAFDSADLVISASSDENRTEPAVVFDPSRAEYRYDNVRRQLGQATDGSWIQERFEDRGILSLKARPEWSPRKDLGDYVRPQYYQDGPVSLPYISWLLDAARFEGPDEVALSMNSYPLSNYTAFLDRENGGIEVADAGFSLTGLTDALASIYPDPSFTSLVQEILQNGGDIAHGLSSLITVLSGSAYYDQLAQFDGHGPVEQTMFVLVLTPQRHRGYIAVVVVALIHLSILAAVLIIFLADTEVSFIGNAWQSLAQIKDPRTDSLLDLNTLAVDAEVEEWMRGNSKTWTKELQPYAKTGLMKMNEDDGSASQMGLRPHDVVGIGLARSGTRTHLMVS